MTAVAVDLFERERPRLRGLAYRITGSRSQADDLVQDAWLRLTRHKAPIANGPAFLTRVVTRLAIDHLRSARVRRQTYVGPWLPEPLLEAIDAWQPPAHDPEANVAMQESLRMAFLVVLETLGPVERAVFLLRDIFDRDYADIASIVERSVPACRQMVKRARARVADGRPRFAVDDQQHRETVARFATAVATGDVTQVTALLTADARMVSDGGGKVNAARKPVVGATKLANFFIKTAAKSAHLTPRFMRVNGLLGIAFFDGPTLSTVMVLRTVGGQIDAVFSVRNPDKLTQTGATP